MICDHCGKWNSPDSTFCCSCGRILNHNDFSLYHFFIENKDLFIIFGVFGALSLYFTSFGSNNLGLDIKGFVYKFSIYDIHFLNLAIASALFILIILSILIIVQGFRVSKYQGFFRSYVIGKGCLERLVFFIPFVILIFGIFGYLYYAYLDEINQIGVIYGWFLSFFAVFFLTIQIQKKYNKRWGMWSLVYFVFWFIAGIVNLYLMPLMPSNGFLINALFTFNILFGQGVAIFCILFFLAYIFERYKNWSASDGVLKKKM